MDVANNEIIVLAANISSSGLLLLRNNFISVLLCVICIITIGATVKAIADKTPICKHFRVIGGGKLQDTDPP
jgi:hypothetical protein